MSPRDQLIAWIVSVAVLLTPLIGVAIKILLLVGQNKVADLEAKKAEALRLGALAAAHYAEEVGEAKKQSPDTPVDKTALAVDVLQKQFTQLSKADATIAVKTAVGATPGLGASANKENA